MVSPWRSLSFTMFVAFAVGCGGSAEPSALDAAGPRTHATVAATPRCVPLDAAPRLLLPASSERIVDGLAAYGDSLFVRVRETAEPLSTRHARAPRRPA